MKTRILLVDDDESFRPALEKVLARMGHAITPAPDGKRALELLAATRFDLVISDIRMPELDGIELTRAIKGGDSPIPVILVTGFSDILETKEAYELGADAFLPKPIDRDELSEAIARCLSEAPRSPAGQSEAYCRLGIDDFTSGRQILFNIFLELAPSKIVKIAHSGEDLSLGRIRAFKAKGVCHLHLRSKDFRTYVGFTPRASQEAARDKKLRLLKRTGELLLARVARDGLDADIYDGAVAFVIATVDVLTDDPDVFELLEILNSHTDNLYAHSVAVSFYGVLLAKAVAWTLPPNRFKVAVGGLLHDIGQKEIPRELLMRARKDWSVKEVQLYESHPARGTEILGAIRSIPSDVLHIVKEHHENCLAQGFPSRLRRSGIHPMAKLVAVANEFCARVIDGPNGPGLRPDEALAHISEHGAERFDSQFLEAMMGLFKEHGR